jgi:hypothetical protein
LQTIFDAVLPPKHEGNGQARTAGKGNHNATSLRATDHHHLTQGKKASINSARAQSERKSEYLVPGSILNSKGAIKNLFFFIAPLKIPTSRPKDKVVVVVDSIFNFREERAVAEQTQKD